MAAKTNLPGTGWGVGPATPTKGSQRTLLLGKGETAMLDSTTSRTHQPQVIGIGGRRGFRPVLCCAQGTGPGGAGVRLGLDAQRAGTWGKWGPCQDGRAEFWSGRAVPQDEGGGRWPARERETVRAGAGTQQGQVESVSPTSGPRHCGRPKGVP